MSCKCFASKRSYLEEAERAGRKYFEFFLVGALFLPHSACFSFFTKLTRYSERIDRRGLSTDFVKWFFREQEFFGFVGELLTINQKDRIWTNKIYIEVSNSLMVYMALRDCFSLTHFAIYGSFLFYNVQKKIKKFFLNFVLHKIFLILYFLLTPFQNCFLYLWEINMCHLNSLSIFVAICSIIIIC